MKRTVCTLAAVLAASRLFAQGTMLVDQQSFDLATAVAATPIAGIGQSFTPGLSSIDYVQLGVADTVPGSMLYINLRQNSMSGQHNPGRPIPILSPLATRMCRHRVCSQKG